MKALETLLRHYNDGDYTVTDIMLEVLQLATEDNVDAILSYLPVEVGVALRHFVSYYHPGVGVFNAPKPSLEAVQLVKERLSKSQLFRDTPEAQ